MSRGSRSIQSLAAYSDVSDCPTASQMFWAGVDTAPVLKGTDADPRFLQSRLAIKRGVMFEALLGRDNYSALVSAVSGAIPLKDDLTVHGPDDGSDASRWETARSRIDRALVDGSDALLHSVRMESAYTGGYLEADLVVVSSGTIHVGEVKSWPMVDGTPADPAACGRALDQAATYVMNLSRTWPGKVSRKVVLVNPLNVGFDPVATPFDVRLRCRKMERSLGTFQEMKDMSSTEVPGIAPLIERLRSEDNAWARKEIVAEILDLEAVNFSPSACSRSCGLFVMCHERAYERRDICVLGDQVSRDLPGVTTLDRVGELASGDTPQPSERLAAERLRSMGRLLEEVLA